MDEDIKLAIDTPRPHHQLVPMKVFYEMGVKKVKSNLSKIQNEISNSEICKIPGNNQLLERSQS